MAPRPDVAAGPVLSLRLRNRLREIMMPVIVPLEETLGPSRTANVERAARRSMQASRPHAAVQGNSLARTTVALVGVSYFYFIRRYLELLTAFKCVSYKVQCSVHLVRLRFRLWMVSPYQGSFN